MSGRQITLLDMLDLKKILLTFALSATMFLGAGYSVSVWLNSPIEDTISIEPPVKISEASPEPSPSLAPVVIAQEEQEEPVEQKERLDAMHRRLSIKAEKYKEWAMKQTDEYEWVGSKCNGLFWNTIFVMVGGWAPITEAQSLETKGKWNFHPARDCLPAKVAGARTGALSTIDELNLTALTLHFYREKNTQGILDLIAYGEGHNWYMGESVDEETAWRETKMKDNLKNTLYNIRKKLSGENLPEGLAEWQMPPFNLKGEKAFAAGFEIFTRMQVRGAASAEDIGWFRYYSAREPRNGFLQAVYAQITDNYFRSALDIGLNNKYFPQDRLPSTKDRCEEFLFRIEQNSPGFKPCPPAKIHSGIDLLLLNGIVNGKFALNS